MYSVSIEKQINQWDRMGGQVDLYIYWQLISKPHVKVMGFLPGGQDGKTEYTFQTFLSSSSTKSKSKLS